MVNRILSNIQGTSLNDVENILRHQFNFPIEVIHNFVDFIITTPTNDIEFDEKENCRLPIIYRHPRENIKSLGAFSRFIPDDKLQVKAHGVR